jgi:hypothetical protein
MRHERLATGIETRQDVDTIVAVFRSNVERQTFPLDATMPKGKARELYPKGTRIRIPTWISTNGNVLSFSIRSLSVGKAHLPQQVCRFLDDRVPLRLSVIRHRQVPRLAHSSFLR